MLHEKNAVIYGATGGIGQAICRELNARGAKLFLLGRSKTQLAQLVQELGEESHQYLSIPSLTTEGDIKTVQSWLKSHGCPYHIGVHAAGQGITKNISALTLKEWNEVMDINLTSAFAFSKLLISMKEERQYDLIFFGSASVENSWPKNSLYGAGKAGLEYFVKTLQREIRPKGGRAWLYRAGSVNTNFFKQIKNHLPVDKMIDPKTLAEIVTNNLEVTPKIYSTIIPLYSE